MANPTVNQPATQAAEQPHTKAARTRPVKGWGAHMLEQLFEIQYEDGPSEFLTVEAFLASEHYAHIMELNPEALAWGLEGMIRFAVYRPDQVAARRAQLTA